jgi:hypothetical protein
MLFFFWGYAKKQDRKVSFKCTFKGIIARDIWPSFYSSKVPLIHTLFFKFGFRLVYWLEVWLPLHYAAGNQILTLHIAAGSQILLLHHAAESQTLPLRGVFFAAKCNRESNLAAGKNDILGDLSIQCLWEPSMKTLPAYNFCFDSPLCFTRESNFKLQYLRKFETKKEKILGYDSED